MSRKLTKQEKIDFIKSLDSLSEHEKSLLLAEIEKIDTLEALERYIDEIYQQAYKLITERITAFSEKYAKDGKLPLFLANFVLSMGEKREFFNNVEKFKKKYPEHEDKVQISANPTRIEALTTENKMTMIDVTEKVNHKIEMHLKGTYQETYLERKFKYAKETGKEPVIQPERLDENVIDDIISRTFDGKRFSERIWGLNMDRVVGKVEHLVRDSLARDIPPSDNAKVLAVEFQVARHRAVTVLQTETNNIQAEATIAEYEDDDVKRYKYLATLEVHTCPICGELDGKIFKVKDARRGINYPTMHPHCRCTTVPAIEDVGSRTAKDVVTGKTYNVKKGTTYEQWRQQQLDKHGIYAIDDKLNAERLEKQRVKTTKAQFLEFRQILGKENMPKTFAEFYDMKYNNVEGYNEIKDRVKWSKAKFPTEKSLNGHFKDHGQEFGAKSPEEYQQLAGKLLSSSISENIIGYDNEVRRVRYNRETGTIAIGKRHASGKVRITTMFKPDDGEEYYHEDYKKEHNNG